MPDRFFEEPITSGRRQGDVLDRRRFLEVVETYYRLMGWDDLGRPTEATLLDHKLEWVLKPVP